jgi:hypothetical protein
LTEKTPDGFEIPTIFSFLQIDVVGERKFTEMIYEDYNLWFKVYQYDPLSNGT